MSLDLIKVNENGQLELDFESLEAQTSKELVEYVKKELTSDNSVGSFLNVQINHYNFSSVIEVDVFIVTGNFGYQITQRTDRVTGHVSVAGKYMLLGYMERFLQMRHGDKA